MPRTNRVASRIRTMMIVVAFAMGCDAEPVGLPGTGMDYSQAVGQATVRKVRVMEPAELDLASPAGLAYSSIADLLLVTPASGDASGVVDEVGLITMREQRVGTVRLAVGVSDPVNVAFDGMANRLLVFQPAGNELVGIPASANGTLQPENLEVIGAEIFGVRDPQGLAVDPTTGRLFVLDAVGPRVVMIDPHPRFGLEQPTVLGIDLDGGLSRPRGLAFDPTTGHLHVLDHSEWTLHELTETGRSVAVRDLSDMGNDLRSQR